MSLEDETLPDSAVGVGDEGEEEDLEESDEESAEEEDDDEEGEEEEGKAFWGCCFFFFFICAPSLYISIRCPQMQNQLECEKQKCPVILFIYCVL